MVTQNPKRARERDREREVKSDHFGGEVIRRKTKLRVKERKIERKEKIKGEKNERLKDKELRATLFESAYSIQYM